MSFSTCYTADSNVVAAAASTSAPVNSHIPTVKRQKRFHGQENVNFSLNLASLYFVLKVYGKFFLFSSFPPLFVLLTGFKLLQLDRVGADSPTIFGLILDEEKTAPKQREGRSSSEGGKRLQGELRQ